jgi:hypothetical protein
MKKKDLIKAIILEAVQRNLAEMPQIKRFYTLTDDWETNLSGIENLKRTNKYKEVKDKIEVFRDKNHFNNDDIQSSFGFKRPQSANAFIKLMLDNNVIIRVDGNTKKDKAIDINPDDEFSLDLGDDSQFSMEDIDIASVLRKINLDKKYRVLNFQWREEGQYRQPIYQFQTTRYRFLKPFLEGGYYKNIPSEEIVKLIQPNRWSNPTVNVLDLFPTQKDFYQFIDKNPSVVKQGNWSAVPQEGRAPNIIITARKS